jgi:hypothetical protein
MWLRFWVSGDGHGAPFETLRIQKAKHEVQFLPSYSNKDTITIIAYYDICKTGKLYSVRTVSSIEFSATKKINFNISNKISYFRTCKRNSESLCLATVGEIFLWKMGEVEHV